MPLLDGFAEYQRAAGLTDNTIKGRERVLRQLARHAGRPLVDLTVEELRRYIGRGGIAPSTRRIEHHAIRAFYRYLTDEGIITTDPTLRLRPPKVPRREPRPFTPEQVERMLGCGAYRRTRAMIILGAFQGFRVSQIARVRGEDIDLESGTIRTIGKGGVEGVLSLHPLVAELAQAMPRRGYWFPARCGRQGHIKPASVTNLIYRAKLRAGITDPRLTAHSLRHTFGTELVEAGVDIRIVQELMMHASLSTTQIYTRVGAARKREAIAKLPPVQIPRQSGRWRHAA